MGNGNRGDKVGEGRRNDDRKEMRDELGQTLEADLIGAQWLLAIKAPIRWLET